MFQVAYELTVNAYPTDKIAVRNEASEIADTLFTTPADQVYLTPPESVSRHDSDWGDEQRKVEIRKIPRDKKCRQKLTSQIDLMRKDLGLLQKVLKQTRNAFYLARVKAKISIVYDIIFILFLDR